MTTFYHDGMRALQDRFDSRRIADRLEQVTLRRTLSDADRAVVDGASMVFLATADGDGRPDCSYKGGHPGFVRCLDDRSLAFAVYDGNGQFRSLGNIVVQSAVGLLFIDFAKPRRMRVNGDATVVLPEQGIAAAELVASFHGAEAVVRVAVREVFPNCGRYVHEGSTGISEYAPAPGHEPPAPAWKSMEPFRDHLRGPSASGSAAIASNAAAAAHTQGPS